MSCNALKEKKTVLKSAWQPSCLHSLLNYGSLGWKTLIATKCQVCSMKTCQGCLLNGELWFWATIRAIVNAIVYWVTKSNRKSHSLREKLCIHIIFYRCMFNINCMFKVKCQNLWGKQDTCHQTQMFSSNPRVTEPCWLLFSFLIPWIFSPFCTGSQNADVAATSWFAPKSLPASNLRAPDYWSPHPTFPQLLHCTPKGSKSSKIN